MGLVKNLAQEAAIKKIDGPVIIVSCPGSGKTTTLVRRIKNIIDHNVDPKKILMVTFANDAAKEMEAKYKAMYGKNPGVNFSTIHSLSLNILRIEKGYDINSIMQENEKMEFFTQLIKYNPQVNDAWELARQVIIEISNVKNNYINLRTYNAKCVDKQYFIELYQAYEKHKQNNELIDFDDMIIKALHLLEDDKEIRTKWQNRFEYIQCDEYQDTNKIQRDILYILSNKHKNLCVVGDDDQSIYRFRGADYNIMLGFQDDFKNAKRIDMGINYRSTQSVVDIANVCIKRNKRRFDKDFVSYRGVEKGQNGKVEYKPKKDKAEELKEMIVEIKNRHKDGVPYKDMAILFRTNKQVNAIAEALSNEKIPYNSSEKEKSVFESWIFQDIKAYIELSLGIDTNYNLRKVLNHPNRYLQSQRFMDCDYSLAGLRHSIQYLRRQGVPNWQYEAAEESIELLNKYFGIGKLTLSSSPMEVYEGLTAINYMKYLKDSAKFRNEELSSYMDDYNILKAIAGKFNTIEKWLDYAKKNIMLVRERNKKRDKNGIVIMTMHSAKGLEWDSVFLTGISKGIVPSNKAKDEEDIAEERRIFYVAMTRAKDYLYITGTKESEFMSEIREDLSEKKEPKITKRMAGTKIYHMDMGDGKVVNYTKDKIRVRFKNGAILEYPFPEVFEKKIMKYIK